MKAKKMRAMLPMTSEVGGIKKVAKVLRNVDGEMQVIHDFRQYLIKDGVLQDGCHIVRAKLTAPTKEGVPIATEGYIVGYEEMLENGELVHEEGALKVILPKLNVGNKINPIVMQSLIIYSDDGIDNEEYAKNKTHTEAVYYSEKDYMTESYEPVTVLINDLTLSNPVTAVKYGIYSSKAGKVDETLLNKGVKYGVKISFSDYEKELHGSEILYIKDVYIIA